jgi:multidrug efflux pump subunit AcrB
VGVASLCLAIYLTVGGVIGSEFLPHLDEGALWVRGTLAPSTGPTEGIRLMNQARLILCSWPEVTQCTSQTGRPDDGTDTTSFFNTEYFVDLKPKEEWRPGFHQNKEEVIAAMNRELDKLPGVVWGFSQPIADNMEEAVSGVKGQLATKVYGDDLHVLEDKAEQIVGVMRSRSRESRIWGCFGFWASRTTTSSWIVRQPRAIRSMSPTFRMPLIRRREGMLSLRCCRASSLRPGDALPPAVPQHQGGDREHSPLGSHRRAGFARAAVQG